MSRSLILFGVILLMTGCGITGAPVKSSNVNENGILAGKVVIVTANNVPWKSTITDYSGSLVVDGTDYIGSMDDGYFMLSLPAGKHTITSISPYIFSGPSYRQSNIVFPINKEVTLEPGRISNLGLLLILMSPEKEGGFNYFIAENNDAILDLFKSKNHEAYSAWDSKSISMIPAERYVDDEQLKSLRMQIARQMLPIYREHISYVDKGYISGALGTIARMLFNTKGKLMGLRLVENSSLATMGGCTIDGLELFCLSKDYAIGHAVLDNMKQNKQISLPDAMVTRSSFNLTNESRIAIDSHFKILSSEDNGLTWKLHDHLQLDDSLPGYAFIKLHEGKEGFYIHATDGNNTILYSPYQDIEFTKVLLPESSDYIGSVVETEDGLYVGPEITNLGDASIYFKGKGMQQWISYTVPSSNCSDMSVTGKQVTVKCNKSDKWVSTDGGVTWQGPPSKR